MAYQLDDAVAATRKWLELRNDVLIVGDDGSGKTTVLRSIATSLRRTSAAIMIEGSTANPARPLLPLAQHPIAMAGTPGKLTPTVIENAFIAELELRPSFVLVDDLHQLDPETVTALGSILHRSGALLIASADLSFAHEGNPQQLGILSRRLTAEVRIEPLGYAGVGQALTEHLGASPDAALLASIVSRSAGNRRVALAVADAARWAGSIQREGDVWSETGSIDDVPFRSVVYALTGRLGAVERHALELLSWAGPVRIAEADKLVGSTTVESLAHRNRLVTYADAGAEVLAVSPPALAKGLRQQMTEVQRHRFASTLRSVLGADHERIVTAPGPLDTILEASDVGSKEYWRFAADLASVVQDRGAVQENLLWSRWDTNPTVVNAVALLESTIGRPSTRDLDEVFRSTTVSKETPNEARSRFILLHAHWAAGTNDPARALDVLSTAGSEEPAWANLLAYLSGVYEHNGSGTPTPRPDPEALAALGPAAQDWLTAAQAHLLLENAQAEETIELITDAERAPANPHVRLFLEASYSDALLVSGNLEALERHSRTQLHDASDQLDPARIRIHALGLAEAFFFGGHKTAAWQVLSTALRLGPPGPFDVGRYSRIVAIAIALQLPSNNSNVVNMLRRELNLLHDAVQSPFGNPREWAEAYLLSVDGHTEEAKENLWKRGLDAVHMGYLTAAALYWGTMVGPLSPERGERINNLINQIPPTLFSPYLRLQVAMAGTSEEALIAALRNAPREVIPQITELALNRLQEIRANHGGPAVSNAEIAELIGALPAKAYRPALPGDELQGKPLTDREHEVAILARSGKTNREIARELTLSTRTVENHVYRALRKLGISNRIELSTQWDPV